MMANALRIVSIHARAASLFWWRRACPRSSRGSRPRRRRRRPKNRRGGDPPRNTGRRRHPRADEERARRVSGEVAERWSERPSTWSNVSDSVASGDAFDANPSALRCKSPATRHMLAVLSLPGESRDLTAASSTLSVSAPRTRTICTAAAPAAGPRARRRHRRVQHLGERRARRRRVRARDGCVIVRRGRVHRVRAPPLVIRLGERRRLNGDAAHRMRVARVRRGSRREVGIGWGGRRVRGVRRVRGGVRRGGGERASERGGVDRRGV